MKRDLLPYLLIFSLAVNVGAIGALVYLRYQERREPPMTQPGAPLLPLRELWGKLNLEPEQRQALMAMAPEHRQRVREFRRELAQKRRDLVTLLKAPEPPAWPQVQSKVREIGDLQEKLQEEVMQHLLAVQSRLKPEQRAALVDFMEQRLMSHHMGPPMGMGPGRGMGRGMGRGPGPLSPAPPPAGEQPGN